MGFLVLGNPKQRQVSTNKNLMDTDCFHKVNLMDTACFYQGNPMNTCMQDTTKNELIGYACPYMQARAYRSLMQVTSQLFSPAHSPSELAPMHVQPKTLLLVAQALDASCIYTEFFSKNGFSYEYHYDFNQLTALYLKMVAPKGRLSLRSKDDCIVRLWLRCDGCDFTLNKQDSQHILSEVSKLVAG